MPSTLALIAALALPLSLARADLLLVQEVETEGSRTEMTMRIKGSKVRVDATPMATSIIDTTTGDMVNLIHPQKMVMRMSGAQLADMAKAFKPATPEKPVAQPDLKPSGKKETIAGYPAEEYVTEVEGTKMSLWLTKAVPEWEKIVAELGAMSRGAWAKQFQGPAQVDYDPAKLPGLPVKTEMTPPTGGKVVILFKSMDRKALPDADFAIPEGYKEMQMPAMGMPATAEP